MVLTPSTMLPLGTRLPSFALPDYNGRVVSTEDFRAAPALLVAFICGHCPFVAPFQVLLPRVPFVRDETLAKLQRAGEA